MSVINDSITSHSDKDLVQLAGYYAYRKPQETQELDINGKKFRVEHALDTTESGLDAFTVRNVTSINDKGEIDKFKRNEDGELIIVYVGSEQKEDWVDTNPYLVTYHEPEQLREAQQYYEDVQQNRVEGVDLTGTVESVTGNSLAGANANSVGVRNPEVDVVTLNPGPLPKNYNVSDENFSNITNYYDRQDFLVNTLKILGYDSQIPGELREVHSGLPDPTIAQIGIDHRGYPKELIDGEFKVEVGNPDEPGHGYINVGADEFIITSIWTGSPLYGETEIIDINYDTLITLADGVAGRITDEANTANLYLDNAKEMTLKESDNYESRKAELQEVFSEKINELGGDQIFRGIADTGNLVKEYIDHMIQFLNKAEDKCRDVNAILNAAPAEVMEGLLHIDISVETLFQPPKNALKQINSYIDELIATVKKIINNKIPEIFADEVYTRVDAVVDELLDHYNVIDMNKLTLQNQLIAYDKQIREVAQGFKDRDQLIADAIQTGSIHMNEINRAETLVKDFTMESSDFLSKSLLTNQIDNSFTRFKSNTLEHISPILETLDGSLNLLKQGLSYMEETIRTLGSNVLLRFLSDYSSLLQSIQIKVDEICQEVHQVVLLVEGMSKAVIRLITNLPGMVDYFKDYIEMAILDEVHLKNIQLYNMAAEAIYQKMEVIFNDIVAQLAQEKARAVDVSVQDASYILNNVLHLKSQVNKAIEALG